MNMLKVDTIVKPFKFETIIKILKEADVKDISFYEIKGYGRQKGYIKEIIDTSALTIQFLPKISIEFYIEQNKFESTIARLLKEIQTGTIGDGKIIVEKVDRFFVF
ncbi:hypothetical protein HY745_13285 [Candidatus Desantisbacteria bacterium]|nr:hypothetical protein [Candidatus Desantisbacteria bacterium]